MVINQSWSEAELADAKVLVHLALKEDLADSEDVTSNLLIPAEQEARVAIVSRAPGVLAGLPVIPLVLQEMNSLIDIELHLTDGAPLQAGDRIAELHGSLREILTSERTILNFLTHLSGIATETQRFVQLVRGTKASILDTRKTLPGWRSLQKYAVRMGGGQNHRMGLYDAIMLKDNHWAGITELESISEALIKLKTERAEGIPIIIEVDRIEQLEVVLNNQIDVVLLDNMSLEDLREAVGMRDQQAPAVQLEASGGITTQTVRDIAETGVDRISIGGITHSVTALDLAFDWME